MATIIPLNAHTKKITLYANGAWSLAQAVLWPDVHISDTEAFAAKMYIHSFLAHQANPRKAFREFCERIIIARQYLAAKNRLVIAEPAIWFNPDNAEGFAFTKPWIKQIAIKRLKNRRFLQHLAIFAKYYQQYVKVPSPLTFKRCCRRLIQLKAFHLHQHFCNGIAHFVNL